ncbi:MAG TPA: serine/threonine-protein kinase [Pyrinomonadaceae bacterium]|nr:serine/threonine-protein kinase [Pyrinomonadaceae bacterium]
MGNTANRSSSDAERKRWHLIDRLFDEAIDIVPADRADFIARRCAGDEALMREITSLLDAAIRSEGLFESPQFTEAEPADDQFKGKRFGLYRLLSLIGRGGMGSVYLAVREEDFSKKVAVKVIPPLSDSPTTAANFRRERQILARLDHPNIARLLDGGTSPNGTPFLVMEYIEGKPIDQYCDDAGLTTIEKLHIFEKVCHAVSFAHQNLVVHRDLKPQNILVRSDASPILLDFGIAKLLESDDGNTVSGFALTPDYAAPEQIRGENITTATDVYSLGVILFEMVVGKRPFALSGKSLPEMSTAIGRGRPIGRDEIEDEDLRAIITHSLAASASERYQTVDELGADIARLLQNEPIKAKPASPAYRFRKYARRHRLAIAAAAIAVLLIAGWAGTFAWQFANARLQASANRRAAYAAEMTLAAKEFEGANVTRAAELVDKYDPEKNPAGDDLRGFEWYLLHKMIEPKGRIRSLPHPDEVWSTSFSADGKLLGTACDDGIVRIYGVADGQLVSQTAPDSSAWIMRFLPDGKRFAVASGTSRSPSVKIYDSATGAFSNELKGHTARVRALAISPDGKLAATGSADGTLRFWDLGSGKQIRIFNYERDGRPIEVNTAEFSLDGRFLAFAVAGTVSTINTSDWTRKESDPDDLAEHEIETFAWSLAYSPLGKTIAAGMFSGEVGLFDAATLKLIKVLRPHRANVKGIAFTPDGSTLITSSWDRTLMLIRPESGEVLADLKPHLGAIHDVQISPDGRTIATAGADLRVNISSVADINDGRIPSSETAFATVSDDLQIISHNSLESRFGAWNTTDGTPQWSLKSRSASSTAISSAIGGIFLQGDSIGRIAVRSSSNGSLVNDFKIFERPVTAVQLSPDHERAVATDTRGGVTVFDPSDGRTIFELNSHTSIAKVAIFSPDAKMLVTGGNDKAVKVWDMSTGELINDLRGHTEAVTAAAFSADGKLLATGSADDTIKIWRCSDWKLERELGGFSNGVASIVFTPDGTRLAAATDVGLIRFWDPLDGLQVFALSASEKGVNKIAFSDGGKILVSIDAGAKIRLWRTV